MSTGYYPSIQGPRPSVPQPAPEEKTVILCLVGNVVYPISEQTLDTVIKTYGDVVQRVVYERNGVWQAVVQYASAASAASAKQALEGHAIFEGGYNKLKVFSSSKQALEYARSAIALPDYKLSEQESANVRAVVNGDDYLRAHSDVGRGAHAALTGQALPSAFIPISISQTASQTPVAPVPVAGAQVYMRPDSTTYINGPPPHGSYVAPSMPSSSYHPMQPQRMASYQSLPETRMTRQVPMTTYQRLPSNSHPLPSRRLATRNSQGH